MAKKTPPKRAPKRELKAMINTGYSPRPQGCGHLTCAWLDGACAVPPPALSRADRRKQLHDMFKAGQAAALAREAVVLSPANVLLAGINETLDVLQRAQDKRVAEKAEEEKRIDANVQKIGDALWEIIDNQGNDVSARLRALEMLLKD